MPLQSSIPMKLALCLALSAAAGWAQTRVTGRVLEKAAMAPVPGALVQWRGGAYSGLTDTAGRFALGSAAAVNPAVNFASPYFRAGRLRIGATQSNQEVNVSVYDAVGESLSSRRFVLHGPELQDLDVLPDKKGSFLGFVVVRSLGHAYRFKVMHQGQPVAHTEASLTAPASALTKPAAGQVDVSMAGLIPKTVDVSADIQDLGDIVLDYPPRTATGVGAARPYGTIVLFDGTRGPGAGAAEQQAKWVKWRDWTNCAVGGTSTKNTSPANFAIARDPQFLNDTNRVTLRSQVVTGSATRWGCDDIEARPNLYAHGDVQLHVEFNIMGVYGASDPDNPNAAPPYGSTAGAAYYVNSGFYVQNRYEIQIQSNSTTSAITDCHAMGSIVDEYAPSATLGRGAGASCTATPSPCPGCGASNQLKENGQWQAYDITFRTSRWNGATRTEYGYMTVWWNGVKVHHNRLVTAAAGGTSNTSGENMDNQIYGIKLQREANDVRFRNIWMKRLKIDSTNTDFGY